VTPDSALVVALQRGDHAAFAEVHARYGPRIFTFLCRMTGRTHLAEDLYQETWVKLAVHATRLAADTDLPAWLYTVARNLARSERRSLRSRSTAGEEAAETADRGGSPFDWAAATQTQARLEEALGALPAPFREVILLVVVEGLDHERAATVLALSPEALRQRLARARAKLAEHLARSAPRKPGSETRPE
jgi:RNA polymerase sigma-70 factor (ECF subfamily)